MSNKKLPKKGFPELPGFSGGRGKQRFTDRLKDRFTDRFTDRLTGGFTDQFTRRFAWLLQLALYTGAFLLIFTLTFLPGQKPLNPLQNSQRSAGVHSSAQLPPTENPFVHERQKTPGSSKNAESAGQTSTHEPTVGTEGVEQKSTPASAKASLYEAKDFASPVRGEILRPVGNYYDESLKAYLFNPGTDYAEPEGTVIRASKPGIVVFAGRDPILGGKVTLDCGDQWFVTYGGLENLRVHKGEQVEAGAALGQVAFKSSPEGQGRPLLHYEVWHGDSVQNPNNQTNPSRG